MAKFDEPNSEWSARFVSGKQPVYMIRLTGLSLEMDAPKNKKNRKYNRKFAKQFAQQKRKNVDRKKTIQGAKVYIQNGNGEL